MRKTQLAFVALFAIVAIVASSVLVSAQETQVTNQAPILTDDQKTELRTMMEQFRAGEKTTVESKLSEFGITITESQSPREFMSSLTQDQRDALRTEITAMREAFREQIKAKLGEWGVQLPDPGMGPMNDERPGPGMGPMNDERPGPGMGPMNDERPGPGMGPMNGERPELEACPRGMGPGMFLSKP